MTDKKSTKYVPQILDERRPSAARRLRQLLKNKSITIIDDLENEQKELTVLEKNNKGFWIYYPWRSCIVHTPGKGSFRKVRISRNFNLIIDSEQKKFEKFRVGIAGLNAGNPAAVCIALEGGGKMMKLADPDPLTLSNLNRFRAGLADLGVNKAVLTARQVYEINPFASVEIWDKGLNEKTLSRFLTKPKVDILIEEMDDLKLKITIRELARKHRIPVIMVTGNGENVIVDVERYDLNSKLPLLNGLLKEEVYDKIMNSPRALGGREKIMLARDFMGKKFLVKRLLRSFNEVGVKLLGIPQLAESSFLRGAALCYLVRKISTGMTIPSGRYHLRIDSFLNK